LSSAHSAKWARCSPTVSLPFPTAGAKVEVVKGLLLSTRLNAL
jgi:hypothetical protein